MNQKTQDATVTERLLQQVRSGNRKAFEQVLAQHRSYLRQFVQLRFQRATINTRRVAEAR